MAGRQHRGSRAPLGSQQQAPTCLPQRGQAHRAMSPAGWPARCWASAESAHLGGSRHCAVAGWQAYVPRPAACRAPLHQAAPRRPVAAALERRRRAGSRWRGTATEAALLAARVARCGGTAEGPPCLRAWQPRRGRAASGRRHGRDAAKLVQRALLASATFCCRGSGAAACHLRRSPCPSALPVLLA